MKAFFKRVWEKWKVIAHIIGKFNTKVILTLAYFLIISPIGAIFRLFGWNPLDKLSKNDKAISNWKEIENKEPDIQSLKRQS